MHVIVFASDRFKLMPDLINYSKWQFVSTKQK